MSNWESSFDVSIALALKFWNMTIRRKTSLSGLGVCQVTFYIKHFSLRWTSRPRDPFTGERLTPRALYGYILSAEGTGPRCLCNHKSFDAIQQGSHASVIRVEAGAHAGEYIAACPIKQCGYIGRPLLSSLSELKLPVSEYFVISLVPLERIHRNGRFSHPFAPKFGELNFVILNKYPLTSKLQQTGEIAT